MQLRIAIAIVAAAVTGFAATQAATTKPASTQQKKKSVHHYVKRSAPVKTTGRTSVRTTAKTPVKTAAKTRSTYHPAQSQPTPERCKEIQDALSKKGYLHGDATGKWDSDSMDALRRFQKDQNLDATGKLDSLTLIALGCRSQCN